VKLGGSAIDRKQAASGPYRASAGAIGASQLHGKLVSDAVGIQPEAKTLSNGRTLRRGMIGAGAGKVGNGKLCSRDN